MPTPGWRPPKRRALFQQGWSAADTRSAVQAWSVAESSRGRAAGHMTMGHSGAAVQPVTTEEANLITTRP